MESSATWTRRGITASAGNDLYHPLQALLIGAFGVVCIYKLHFWVERRFQIDDPVGAVAVHGYAGVIGVLTAGFVLWGYPSSPNPEYASITPWGQFLGAVIMFFVLGFVPFFLAAFLLKRLGLLRIPASVELAGLDHRTLETEASAAREIIGSELEAARERMARQE